MNKIKCKAALCITDNGDWAISGQKGDKDIFMINDARDRTGDPSISDRIYFIEVEVEIPKKVETLSVQLLGEKLTFPQWIKKKHPYLNGANSLLISTVETLSEEYQQYLKEEEKEDGR